MSELRHYISLGEALRVQKIPVENHATIRGIVASVGIEDYYEHSSRGIRAIRRDGIGDLRIEYGHTWGFRTEEEARTAAPGCKVLPDIDRGTGWYVTHVKNQHRPRTVRF